MQLYVSQSAERRHPRARNAMLQNGQNLVI
jgi:hypothetical protein